jgi:WD40 repeat protein
VCFFGGGGKTGDCIASASEDGTIKITSAVSGVVVLELQAHGGCKVRCLHVCTDGTRMASGGGRPDGASLGGLDWQVSARLEGAQVRNE